jgi:hypothetical protein
VTPVVVHIGETLRLGAHQPERRALAVARRRNGDHAPVARPEPVTKNAVQPRRLVAMQLVDERKRRDDAVRGVDVRRHDAHAPAVAH